MMIAERVTDNPILIPSVFILQKASKSLWAVWGSKPTLTPVTLT